MVMDAARLDGRVSFHGQRAINHIQALAPRDLLGTHNGQLALHLWMFDHAFAGGLREPLHHHVYLRSLKTHFNFIRRGIRSFALASRLWGIRRQRQSGCARRRRP